jgi:hypothetical protein
MEEVNSWIFGGIAEIGSLFTKVSSIRRFTDTKVAFGVRMTMTTTVEVTIERNELFNSYNITTFRSSNPYSGNGKATSIGQISPIRRVRISYSAMSTSIFSSSTAKDFRREVYTVTKRSVTTSHIFATIKGYIVGNMGKANAAVNSVVVAVTI